MNKKYIFNLVVYYVLQLTWGCIQNVFGFVVWLYLFFTNPKRNRYAFHGALVTEWNNSFSTGCGMFIFYGHKNSKDASEVLVHEYGHTIQSIILGPLFMLVIGIPSTVWAFTPVFDKWRKDGKYKYCDFYPESWANHLGTKVTGLPAPDR